MKRKLVFQISIRNLIRWLGMGAFACMTLSIVSCGPGRNAYNSGYMPNPYLTNQAQMNNLNRFNPTALVPGTFNLQNQQMDGNLGCVAKQMTTYSDFESACSACSGNVLPSSKTLLKEDICLYNISNQTVNDGMLNINFNLGTWNTQRIKSVAISAVPYATVEIQAKFTIHEPGEEYYIYLQEFTGTVAGTTSEVMTSKNSDANLSMLTPSGGAVLMVNSKHRIGVDGRAFILGCENKSGQFVKCPPGSAQGGNDNLTASR